MNRSGAPIIILDADDVVLAEIAAGLNLDQFQQNLAGIFQPMDRADRDMDRLVLMHGLDEFIDRYARRAAHDDPVLGEFPANRERYREFDEFSGSKLETSG